MKEGPLKEKKPVADFSNQKEAEPTKQIIEGVLGKEEDLKNKLPPEVSSETVETFLGSDGLWHWHLRPEFIEDEKERKKYEDERWDATGYGYLRRKNQKKG